MIALFAIAILIRLIALASSISLLGQSAFLSLTPDTTNYFEAARALAANSNGGEGVIFTFGPGFPFLLSNFIRIFGESPLPILGMQVFLSALSCVLIYQLSHQLLDDYLVARVAGLWATLSVTSITLSCLILSDTFFYFVFLLSLTIFIDAVRMGTWWRFVSAGLLLAMATLTRSVSQFWIFPLAIIAIVLIGRTKSERPWSSPSPTSNLAKNLTTFLLLSLLPIIGWTIRNGVVNDVYALAMTNASGPANVTSLAIEAETGRNFRDIQGDWFADAKSKLGKSQLSLSETYQVMTSESFAEIRRDSWGVLRAYANLVWENVRDRDYLNEVLWPQPNHPARILIRALNHGSLSFWLALTGLIVLLVQRRKRQAIILGSIFLYFAAMTGSFKWQGSRIFHPSTIASTILCSVAAVESVRFVWRHFRRFKQ